MKPADQGMKNGKKIRFLMEMPASRAPSIKKIFSTWAGIAYREVPYNNPTNGDAVSASNESQDKVKLIVTVSCQNFDSFIRVCFKENVEFEAA